MTARTDYDRREYTKPKLPRGIRRDMQTVFPLPNQGDSLSRHSSTRPMALGGLVVFWCILFTATHVPGSVLTKFSLSIYDLAAHFVAYFILTILYVLAFPRREKSFLQFTWRIFAILAVYAVFDELLQRPIPGRFASLSDVGADVGGVILALAGVEGYRWLRRGRRSSEDVAH